MPKTNAIMDFAKENGADLVGIAPVNRFEGAPKAINRKTSYLEPEAL